MMRNSPEPTIAEATIQQFSKEGIGIGQIRYPNDRLSPVEVPFSLPGEKAEVKLLRKQKGVYQSQIQQLIEKSPERIAPRCIHFGSCGGCRWQHLSYEHQLREKERLIQRLMSPFHHSSLTYFPILASNPWQYRNKMEFSFSSDKSLRHYLGLNLYGEKGRVFNIQECHLVSPWFVEAVKAVSIWWEDSDLLAYRLNRNEGSLRTLTLREGQHTGDRLVMLTVSGNPDFALQRQQLNHFVSSLRNAIEPSHSDGKLSIFLRIQQIAKGRPTQFYEMVLYGPDHLRETLFIQDELSASAFPLHFKISPSAFFQPNTEQAEKIYSKALQLINLPLGALVYDLYCGTGTLGICASRKAKKVIGIELSPESVVDARENSKINECTNVEILQGDVGKILESLPEVQEKPDVVMLDPPRAGLDPKAIRHVLKLQPTTILYISCNPYTQAENLKQFVDQGYRLDFIQPIDQFPQTYHVENIAVLSRIFS